MFKILIVDDRIQKINDIRDELKSLEDSQNVIIDYEMEIKKACKALESKQFDLLILDIQLPSLDDKEEISKDGGIGLLKIIDELDRIKKPSFIIGLTGVDENYDSNFNEFQKYLWVLVKYDRQGELWRKQIVQKVNYLLKAKGELIKQYNAENSECQFDCAIITAVEIEMNSVLNCGLEWIPLKVEGDTTTYYQSVCTRNDIDIKLVVAQQHQMGMVAASVLSSKLITNFNPKLICMLGIAAGRQGEVELGDIIIASESWDYGSGKIEAEKSGEGYVLEPEPHQIPIEPSLKEYLMGNFEDILYDIRKKWNSSNGNRQDRDIKIHIGPMASGAAVIQNENVVTQFILPQNRKVLGIDMETYAVYFSACNTKKQKTTFLSIKAVCDYANQYKNNTYQNYSAFASTNFFMNVVNEILKCI